VTEPPVVVVAGGHLIDPPDHPSPRFPADQIDRVTSRIRESLSDWNVGPGTTVICGGARGSDLIVAEEAMVRGATCIISLALPVREFEQRSVHLPGTDWIERFRRVLANADVRDPIDRAADPFEATNTAMVDVALQLDQRPHALLVWDGKQGRGVGGTSDLVRQLKIDGPHARVRVIDPTRRRYEARQSAAGPKRLLALDGGGIRGAISIEILAAMETALRASYGRKDLVLADYFDYIAGTSTGAISAAALSLRYSVDELRRRYQNLGRRVFAKQPLARRRRSIYADRILREQLEDTFGLGRTLGDPDLQSLLLLVMHNVVTDSAWPLSNCTRSMYNDADRNLLTPSDRNIDMSLTPLVRASTAAPIYFQPESIDVGRHTFIFQDGGITPFNNPAMLLFLMATMPEYGLGWATGAENLLLVSVGTGSSPAVHPSLQKSSVTLGFNARNLPSVFMNGASVGQDLLCRAFGQCRFGPPIDREVRDRIGAESVGGRSLFTYVRYEADLSDDGLAAAGITDTRARRRIRKLDAVDRMADLVRVGRHTAAHVDIGSHFSGFLGDLPPSG
jgi:hypothetical protein